MASPRSRPCQRGPVHGHARGESPVPHTRRNGAPPAASSPKEITESQAVFRCKAAGCGHTAHADVNAAINIKHAAGHAVSACGDLGNSRSVKQEPEGRATGRTPS
ncbi:zinc ribbon domain-containing protein [Streptomyces sp. NPDC093982]|uniref:zinc ribbon domain-containing protein n=1 Tax=Streptomyces sp. NPDC093982 TaxID=3155077 RepID=UPI00341BD4BC